MTRMGSASHLSDVRRINKGIRSSKKSVLYSDYYEDETKNESNNLASQRSISLNALHQSSGGTLEPRMAQLETLEAKMASIEVSLSTTPRRKKSGSTASTPVPQTITSVPNINNSISSTGSVNNNVNNNISKTNNQILNGPKNSAKEIETVRITFKDMENNLNCLKNGWSLNSMETNGLNEKEKKLVQEKLVCLKSEMDAKRLTIKNIKIALDTIDISDNIDVRIQQAELEYQLGREELNLLSILEECHNLQSCLEENVIARQTVYSYIGNSAVSLHGVELMYDAKSPQFGACLREGALYIEWAADGSGICKGDRLLEINGKLVIGKNKEDMCRLLSVSPSPAQMVVIRKHSHRPDQIMSHLQAELSVVKEKAGEAERTRDSFRSDNLRLTHRISYLEEQVAELLERARENKIVAIPQVFQKGNQVALVANLPGLDKSHKKLPLPRQKFCEEVRSAKSVDILTEKPKKKAELLQGRSTNSLNVEPEMPMRRHRHRPECSADHFFREQRQKHLWEARSSLLSFTEKNGSNYSDIELIPNNSRDLDSQNECNSESSVRYHKKQDKVRPVPPKKPIRLSLHRATSLQSVDNERKSLKRTHKGEAPPVPVLRNVQENSQTVSQTALCVSKRGQSNSNGQVTAPNNSQTIPTCPQTFQGTSHRRQSIQLLQTKNHTKTQAVQSNGKYLHELDGNWC